MNERVFKLEDYIAVPTIKDESLLDVSKKHFYSVVCHEYWHLDEHKINYSTYLLAQENKLSFNEPLLLGNQVIELPNVMPELDYYRTMYKVIMRHLSHLDFGMRIRVNSLTFKDYDMFFDYMNTLFTDESLINNALLDNIVIDISGLIQEDVYFIRHHPDRDNIKANPIKKYQKGMKLTRFFTSFLEFLNKKDKESEKAVGRFRIDPNDKVKIFMSAYLPSFIKAGAIGHSCLSEGGVNEHATFMTLGYKNLLVIHDSDFSFRAFLALDHINKYFTLAHTYPRENFFLQLITYKYLESLGYKAVRNYFHFPEYMDMGISDHFQAESVKSENKDAYNKFAEGIFKFYSHGKSEAGDQTIACTYGCDGCDKSSINPDFLEGEDYCESCRDNDEDYSSCASCDDRYHNDDLYYDDENEESYCGSCRDSIEEEREEKHQKEEEEAQQAANAADGEEASNEGSNVEANEENNFSDTERLQVSVQSVDLQIGTNLVKQHNAENFYKTLKLMQRVSNLIQPQDIELLAGTQQKISNYREYSIFGSLMGAAGILWADGQRLQDFSPVKDANKNYPYYMNIYGTLENTYNIRYGQNLDSDNEERQGSEMYLRYFYLAKNKLHLIKTAAVEYQTPMLNIPDDFMNLQQKISFAQKTFSHADIYKIIPFEKSAKFTLKDAAAYDIFMFMLHSAGYMWNTKVPLWGRVMPTLDQGFNSEYFYGINNKGFIETWKAEEGAFPQDVVVLTKEIMLGHINK